MTNWNQKRAQKGGEIGVNGLFYPGGSFLPSTQRGKMPKRKKGSGKQQIEPYKWEIPPEEGAQSLMWACGAGVYTKLIWDEEGNLKGMEVVSYESPEGFKQDPKILDRLVAMFNAGERWLRF